MKWSNGVIDLVFVCIFIIYKKKRLLMNFIEIKSLKILIWYKEMLKYFILY